MKEGSQETDTLKGLTLSALASIVTNDFVPFASPIKDHVAQELLGIVLDKGQACLDETGYFDDSRAITICFYQRYRIMTPALPMTIEYEEEYRVYFGTGGNPMQTWIYEREDSYTDYVYTRGLPE